MPWGILKVPPLPGRIRFQDPGYDRVKGIFPASYLEVSKVDTERVSLAKLMTSIGDNNFSFPA